MSGKETVSNESFEKGHVDMRLGYIRRGTVDGKAVLVTEEWFGDTDNFDNRSLFVKFVVGTRVAYVEGTTPDLSDLIGDDKTLAETIRAAGYLTSEQPAHAA